MRASGVFIHGVSGVERVRLILGIEAFFRR